MKIPNDADGDAMRRLIEDGCDLTKPMDIDFVVAAWKEDEAERISADARGLGFITKVCDGGDDPEHESDLPPFTCYCTKTMLLDYDNLISTQNELDRIGRSHGGYSDGWGTFGNKPEPQRGSP